MRQPTLFVLLSCFALNCLTLTACGQSFASGKDAAEPIYYPGPRDWGRVESSQSAPALKELLEFARANQSTGLLVLHRGRIVAEQYWTTESMGAPARFSLSRMSHGQTTEGQPIEDVASVQKSIVAVLVGIACQKNLLEIDQPVSRFLGEGWSKASKTQEQAITIKHLLSMTSGLKNDLSFQSPAGTRWRYNTTAYSKLVDVLEKASLMERNELTRQWLTGPLEMNDSKWVSRPGGVSDSAGNRFGFATTCRDLAKFGLMVSRDGQWKDKAIIENDDYFKAMLRPSQRLNPLYGYLWWLNVSVEDESPATQRFASRRLKNAPENLVSARGALSRRLIIDPDRQLVAVRIGAAAGGRFDQEFWDRLARLKLE